METTGRIESVIEALERSGFGQRADGLHDHAENAIANLRAAARERDSLREALQIALVQLGEHKDGMGAAHYHAANIGRAALNANPPAGAVRLPDGRDVKISQAGMDVLLAIADGNPVGAYVTAGILNWEPPRS